MENSSNKSLIDRVVIDPAFNILENLAIETVKLPINLIRKGVKSLVNGVLSLPIIPVYKSK